MDVATFLSRHPPFDALSAEKLDAVARSVEIEHFAASTVILEHSGIPARFLYVVRKGAVELADEGRVLDMLGEGETFGMFSLLDQASPTATVRAREDTLCYLIGAAVANEILGSEDGRMFVLGTMRQRLEAGYSAVEPPGGPYRPVGGLVRRGVVSAQATMTIAEAAQRMVAERVSSLLVPIGDGWGIVTDRDFRTRVIAAGLSTDVPVAEIASFPVKTLPEDALAGEALIAMFQEGVHHFPIIGAAGGMVGVVTDTDLMDVGRDTPFSVRSAIERARTPEQVAAAGLELPSVVCALVDASSEPVGVGRVIALTIDSMTMQLLHLGIERLGDPPAAWAWMALGSAARHEQALRTDQDHAITYDPQGRPAEEIDPYFAELAEFVTAGLEAAGIPRCKGEAMAVNPSLRRTVEGWEESFRGWMRDPGVGGSILSSIVYDFRHVAGPLDPDLALDRIIREARGDEAFLRHLAHRALDYRPPTGFMGNLVVERKGDNVGRLDIKHGGITIVGNIARAYGVRAGIAAKGTLERLRGAAIAGVLSDGSARELAEAFRYLWEVRLRHQVSQVRASESETPDDFVDPSTLGPFARRGLKEAFHIIARTQRGIATDLGVRPA